MNTPKEQSLMEKIVSFSKRRGFVYPSSEIYDGYGAIYDYGPYGAELSKNIKDAWWRATVYERDNVVGLDSSIFMNPKVWEASGHTTGFSDPMSECKNCHTRVRVDKLLEEVGVAADEKMSEDEINALFDQHKESIACPKCGEHDFTPAKSFNLLVKSNLGNFTSDPNKDPSYLRGETCQGIYINFKNVLDSARVKVPFGVAQIGKAFRNEITARQFIFRTRELEQMELQFFVHPDNEKEEYEKLKEIRWNYYKELGIKEENLSWKKHENLVFYAKEAYDIEYKFPWGFDELEGLHSRGNYDLTQHSKSSGKDLSYRDPQTNEQYIPHIVEASVGVGRTMLAVLTDAYTEEETGEGQSRVVMKFPKKLAPVKVAIFPLLKNKPELVAKAREIYDMLKKDYVCEFDDNGNIGKRYRRQDEIGTPYCVTIDFDSLEQDDVTIRDRDTMEQTRLPLSSLKSFLSESLV